MLVHARRLLVVAMTAAAVCALPAGAAADCAAAPLDIVLDRVAQREGSVFVGEVVGGVRHRPLLRVAEVWSGPDLAPEVTVRTGPDQLPWPLSVLMERVTSSDARLDLGSTHLVAAGDGFATDGCAALPASAELLAARAPDDARPPTPDGTTGHRPGLFDTPLGATVVAVVLAVAGLVLWGRRLDRADGAPAARTARAASRGAVRGAVVGLVGGALAELATHATSQLFPTDVRIAGFGLVFGVPAAAAVGALVWWLGRPRSPTARLALAAVPVVLLAALQVLWQWGAQ